MPLKTTVQLVLCTCPDREVAERIARDLVAQNLAACVSILPGLTSVYRWKGNLETAEEVQLLIKTTAARWEALRDRVLALHPYELPELIAVDVAAGLDRYLQWVAQASAPGL